MNATNERLAFSERLKKALSRAGFNAAGPTELKRAFNLYYKGQPISIFAARKWLLGEAIPTQDKLTVLADWLGVSREWLRFGGATEQDAVVDPVAHRVEQNLPKYSRQELNLLGDVNRLTPLNQVLVREFVTMLMHLERKKKPEELC